MTSIKRFFRRHQWVSILCVVLVLGAVVGLVSGAFNGVAGIGTRNENNYLTVGEEGNYTLTAKKSLLGNTLTVTPNDDGAIKIVGDTTDEETQTVQIASVELKAGTYTFTSGKNGVRSSASEKGVWLTATIGANNGTVIADFGGDDADGTFTLESGSRLIIYVNIAPGEHNVTVYPTIVKGKTAGAFYA